MDDHKDGEESLTFFCIGDFGAPTMEVKQVASAMNTYAETHGRPSFVLGLGDNFYPTGVYSVHDKQFKKSWSDIFLIYESLRVPWNIGESTPNLQTVF
jgi:tartrate-resistant acid phosphatase type 5